MRVPICHHYWKNGQDACWSPQRFPVPEIEQALKADYLALQQERPRCRMYGPYMVFCHYRPTRDIFGREIVPISFAFVKNPPEALAPTILAALARSGPADGFLEIPDAAPPAPRRAQGRRRFSKFLAPVLLLALLALVWLLFHPAEDKSSGEAPAPGAVEPVPTKAWGTSKPPSGSQADAVSTQQESPRSGTIPGSPAPLAGPAPATREAMPDVCGNAALWGELLKCPRAYVEARCANRTALSFRDFRETSTDCVPAYGRLEPWSFSIQVLRENSTLDAKDARALENYIFSPPGG